MTTYVKKIILLSASLLVLAACTGADRPACWKANTKGTNICNSSNGGSFSISKPDMKGKIGKKATPTTPEVPNDTSSTDTTPEDNSSKDTTQDDNQDTTPNQLNSNDVKGFDPFSGLYGPGT